MLKYCDDQTWSWGTDTYLSEEQWCPLCSISSIERIYLISTESTCQSHKARAYTPLHNSLNLLDLNPTTTTTRHSPVTILSSHSHGHAFTSHTHAKQTHTYVSLISPALHPVTHPVSLIHHFNVTVGQKQSEWLHLNSKQHRRAIIQSVTFTPLNVFPRTSVHWYTRITCTTN